MNQNPGEKQSLLRPRWTGSPSNLHTMMSPDDHSEPILRGKAKNVERVLKGRGLWRDRRSDGLAFLLQVECLVDANHTDCDPDIDGLGGCCAYSLLALRPDF